MLSMNQKLKTKVQNINLYKDTGIKSLETFSPRTLFFITDPIYYTNYLGPIYLPTYLSLKLEETSSGYKPDFTMLSRKTGFCII